jgi:hypothetical protein
MEWWKGWPLRGGAFPLRSAWGMGVERKDAQCRREGCNREGKRDKT